MAAADLTGLGYFLPILSFLLVFIVTYAVLLKTKLVEHWFLQLFIPFIIATVFVSAVGARDYVLNIIPWFAILIVSFFLLWVLLLFIGDPAKGMQKGLAIAFVILLVMLFLISAIFVFSDYYAPYLPNGSGAGANSNVLGLVDWIFTSRVAGALMLLIVSGLVSWILVKGGGKK